MHHPDNRALVRYWHALRAGRHCPRRAEIDPRRINGDLGHLFILEDLGRENIRFRLAGSALVEAFWMELRGMPAHAIMAREGRAGLRGLVSRTLSMPGIGQARLMPQANPAGSEWEIALLPLRSEQGDIDRVLGALRPLGAWTASMTDGPLAFTVAAMSVSPISGTNAEHDRLVVGARPRSGTAPNMLSERPDLRAIEGGGLPPAEPAPRPILRIVHSSDD